MTAAYNNNQTVKPSTVVKSKEEQENEHLVNKYISLSEDKKWALYEERIKYFEEYVHPMPLQNNHIVKSKLLGDKQYQSEIISHMQSTHHILHGGTLSLMHRFLIIKVNKHSYIHAHTYYTTNTTQQKKHGSAIERALYRDMDEVGLMNRIATKRCVMFFQSYDAYILRDGFNDSGNWEKVGTEQEEEAQHHLDNNQKKPVLEDYLSYDELLLSSLCGLSSATHFINEGARNNCGRMASSNGTYTYTHTVQGYKKHYVHLQMVLGHVQEYTPDWLVLDLRKQV